MMIKHKATLRTARGNLKKRTWHVFALDGVGGFLVTFFFIVDRDICIMI